MRIEKDEIEKQEKTRREAEQANDQLLKNRNLEKEIGTLINITNKTK